MTMLLFGCLAASMAADESVVNSKHDLSAHGPGPIHALSETQICVFCHTPHRDQPPQAALLWEPTADLARMCGRAACISCHDSHNTARVGHMLVTANTRSALCLTCHKI